MELTKKNRIEIEGLLRDRYSNFFRLVNIIKSTYSSSPYEVHYIGVTIDKIGNRFTYETKYVDESLIRDYKLTLLLKEDEPQKKGLCFDTSNCTQEQISHLQSLRDPVELRIGAFNLLEKVKIEYSQNFKVGQRVYFKGEHGVISFKHIEKAGNIQRWTIMLGDVEHRYIYGTSLIDRKVEDLSHIPIDKKLDKLPTEKLLKMYRRGMKFNFGKGDKRIKRVLMERENVR